MTVFHLLRHGEHVLRGRVLAGRTPGVGLSPRGRAEIAAVADRLAEEQIAALCSSPLQRARESAEILAGKGSICRSRTAKTCSSSISGSGPV